MSLAVIDRRLSVSICGEYPVCRPDVRIVRERPAHKVVSDCEVAAVGWGMQPVAPDPFFRREILVCGARGVDAQIGCLTAPNVNIGWSKLQHGVSCRISTSQYHGLTRVEGRNQTDNAPADVD